MHGACIKIHKAYLVLMSVYSFFCNVYFSDSIILLLFVLSIKKTESLSLTEIWGSCFSLLLQSKNRTGNVQIVTM
jgi:hypothetical protein